MSRINVYTSAQGPYRLATATGLLTTVAAGTASAGHIFAARWPSTTKVCVITRFALKWRTISGFTAGQEVGLDVSIARSYTAAHTGGTQLSNVGAWKKRAFLGVPNPPAPTVPDSAFGAANVSIATTGALTNGTETLDPTPFWRDSYTELAAAATVPVGRFGEIVDFEELDDVPIVLQANEGIVVRNTVLMGAGGTARVFVEMDWDEPDIGKWPV